MQAINVQEQGTPLPKGWNACVGAGKAIDGLRADWQRQLGQMVQQCGFQSARMTGLGPLGQQGWQALDALNDYLMDLDVTPVWRIQAQETPLELESLTRHCIARYGPSRIRSWRFELPEDGLYALRRQTLKTLDDQLSIGPALPLSRLKRFTQSHESDFITIVGPPDLSHFQAARQLFPQPPLHWDAVQSTYGMDDALHLALRLSQLHLASSLLTESFTLASFSGLCQEGAYMIDAYGVQQPCSHAYRMLSSLGEQELIRGSGWILTRDARHRTRALAWSNPHNPRQLHLTSLRPHTRLLQETLDSAHGWAYPVWRQMGCPETLSRYQAQALRQAALHTEIRWLQADDEGRVPWALPQGEDRLVLLKEV